jgi:hypothetical protein
MKICATCNIDISHKRKNAKFCSLSCSSKYNRLLILQKDVPLNYKRCGKCKNIKSAYDFRKNKNAAFGLSYFCKKCDNQRVYTRDKRKVLLNSAKKRAKDNNLEFNITIDDIFLPEKCPILGLELTFNLEKVEDNSYSIDRIDSSKGYIKGNIQIISFKANTIKNNANLQELEAIYFYMKSLDKLLKEGNNESTCCR